MRFVSPRASRGTRPHGRRSQQEESRFLARMVSAPDGEPVHTYEEVDEKDFTRVANTLRLMIDQQRKKAGQS